MTANYEIDDSYSSVEDELLLADDRGYAPGSGAGSSNFWGLKKNTTLKVYFVTPGPWTKQLDHGWWNWREIYAEKGLTGVGELPGGLRSFPVRDQETYRDEEGNLRRRDILPSDPRFDQLLSLVVPYVSDYGDDKKKARKPSRPVRDVVGVSVVEVAPDGTLYPKVLTMSANRYRKLHETISSFRAMDPESFTLMGRPWTIGVQGDTSATEIAILRPISGEPPIDLPEPHDIPELLRQRREAVYAYVQSMTGVDTSAFVAGEHAAPAETASAAEEVAVADVLPDGQPSREALYEFMPVARMKKLLGDKGIPVPPKSTKPELIKLMVDNQI